MLAGGSVIAQRGANYYCQKYHSNDGGPRITSYNVCYTKLLRLDSAIAETIRLFPRNPTYRRRQISRLLDQGRIDAYRAALDSIRSDADTTGRQYALFQMAGLKENFGQFKEAESLRRQAQGA